MQPTPGGPDLSGEWVIRIIDDSPQGVAPGVSHAITEKGLYLVRYRGGSTGGCKAAASPELELVPLINPARALELVSLPLSPDGSQLLHSLQ